MGPPFYPPSLVRCESYGYDKLGNAMFQVMGWTFRFTGGSLRVSAPDGVNVIDLGREDTERFVGLVRALDAGRYTAASFKSVE